MPKSQVRITENNEALGKTITYKSEADKILESIQTRGGAGITSGVIGYVTNLFKEIFLPHGYPSSVSADYIDYQIWDTVQAFCSTITGTFTTRAILEGVGVGNSASTSLAAAITWIIKDGVGMLGRIVFAWWKGTALDADCKQWRLCADILNDVAMFMELLLPYYTHISPYILCMTSSMKAIVGVAGGATRASITQHQAITGNMADVSAKDGSQETCVNLLASILGVVILSSVGDNKLLQWLIFFMFTTVHLLANYYAVRSLVITHVNESRLLLILKTYLQFDAVASPALVNTKEPLFIGNKLTVNQLCNFDIKLGVSMKKAITKLDSRQFLDLYDAFQGYNYLIIPDLDAQVLYICFDKNETSEDIIAAYFHAVMYGIALCSYNGIALNMNVRRRVRHVAAIHRLNNFVTALSRYGMYELNLLPLNHMRLFNEFVKTELTHFFTALEFNEWDTKRHSLFVSCWRMDREVIQPNERKIESIEIEERKDK